MVSSCGEKKQTKGRQKIEIRPISKPSARHVTFTKRRGGLFTKADELAELCGAHVGIIAFSPGNKPFTFGPEVLEQFITSSTGCHVMVPQDTTSEEEIRKEIEELTDKLVLGRQITEKQIFFGIQVGASSQKGYLKVKQITWSYYPGNLSFLRWEFFHRFSFILHTRVTKMARDAKPRDQSPLGGSCRTERLKPSRFCSA